MVISCVGPRASRAVRMYTRGMKRTLIAVGMVFLMACKPGVKKVIEERRAGAQATLDRAQKVGLLLATVPPITSGGARIDAPAIFVANSKDTPLPTATFAYEADLPLLPAPNEGASRLSDTNLLQECGSLLSTGKHVSKSNPNVFENVVRAYLDKCTNVATLFVIRTRAKEARAFQGDVVAFDLRSNKYLGGFALDVKSEGRTDKVTTTSTSTTTKTVGRRSRYVRTKKTTTQYVNADESQLMQEISDAIDEGIREYVPNAQYVE